MARESAGRPARLKVVERRPAETPSLDPAKARQVLDGLYRQGRIRREDLPYSEPREVEVLIVRGEQEEG